VEGAGGQGGYVRFFREIIIGNYAKPDFWALKARKEGYPARSVYKLREIDEKFGLLRRAGEGDFRALDLGAAPGSWSLYMLRKFSRRNPKPPGPDLTAIDLAPLSRQYDQGLFGGDTVCFIQGDMNTPENREMILNRGPYNLILSDAAPATSGNHSVDSFRSLELAETALDYAENALARGGNMAVKIFQGEDTGSFLKRVREIFTSGKSFKPQACRRESFETYFLGLGRL
jgi:23S rRNA (uridine2552-2'-O)-methyltransferase